MTDINGTVVGIQGFAVNNTAPTDGYVLTWSAADGYWVPRPAHQSYTGLRKEYFTASGTWTCPVGVTSILVIAAGGGGGGGGASKRRSAGGGGGSLQQTSYIAVTPGVTYTITVGDGGVPGIGVSSEYSENGSNGLPTTFKNGSTILFSAIGAEGGGGGGASDGGGRGGSNFAKTTGIRLAPGADIFAAYGGDGATINGFGKDGQPNYLNQYVGGAAGTQTVPFNVGGSGGGGGAGPQGDGAQGGTGTGIALGGNGSSAAPNTGAGGGGGGGSYPDYTGGDGGTGGSGYMYIVY